jgi:hypothetical protein
MTKDEFISYIRGVIDMEIETAKRINPISYKDEKYKIIEKFKEPINDNPVAPQEPQYELIGALKLIEDALNKIEQQPPLQTFPTPLTENPVPGTAEPYTIPYQPYTPPYRGGEPCNPYYPPFKVGDIWCNTTNTTLNNDNINLTTK